MADPEVASAHRFRLHNDELSRRHRGLAAQLERVDVEFDRSVAPGRVAELRTERERIAELMGEIEGQMRASRDQLHRSSPASAAVMSVTGRHLSRPEADL